MSPACGLLLPWVHTQLLGLYSRCYWFTLRFSLYWWCIILHSPHCSYDRPRPFLCLGRPQTVLGLLTAPSLFWNALLYRRASPDAFHPKTIAQCGSNSLQGNSPSSFPADLMSLLESTLTLSHSLYGGPELYLYLPTTYATLKGRGTEHTPAAICHPRSIPLRLPLYSTVSSLAARFSIRVLARRPTGSSSRAYLHPFDLESESHVFLNCLHWLTYSSAHFVTFGSFWHNCRHRKPISLT